MGKMCSDCSVWYDALNRICLFCFPYLHLLCLGYRKWSHLFKGNVSWVVEWEPAVNRVKSGDMFVVSREIVPLKITEVLSVVGDNVYSVRCFVWSEFSMPLSGNANSVQHYTVL